MLEMSDTVTERVNYSTPADFTAQAVEEALAGSCAGVQRQLSCDIGLRGIEEGGQLTEVNAMVAFKVARSPGSQKVP